MLSSALCGVRNSVIAVTKLRIFDAVLSAKGIGSDGYEKPKKAHTAKTKNIPARKNRVY
jgi:hypothetical protein